MKARLTVYSMALAVAGVAQAAYTPVAIQPSSYTADVIVEANATPRLTVVTTASVDNGTNNTANTWFEKGFDTNNPANGLPVAGSTFTALDDSTHSFTMPPSYTAPNGILIDTVVTTGTFTLTTPKAYTKLSFLGSGGNGGDVINVKINHQDGTSETSQFACPDWFGGTGVAAIVGGRCNSTVNLTPEVDGNSGDGRGNPRIYYRDINLSNTTSPVTNIVLTYASGQASSHNDIIAVSGATTVGGAVAPIAVTGYDYDFVVEASAPHGGRVVSQTMADGTNVWATSQSMDNVNNTAAAWYEQGYNLNNDASGTLNNPAHDLTGTGLPHPGSYITNSTQDHIYQMPPDYTTANAVYISTTVTNATITLTTPAAFSGLSFLGSAGNGPVTVNVTIHHQDNTSEATTLTVNDWFNGSVPAAFLANGRVRVDNAQFQNVNSGFPRLLQNDIVLANYNSPVTSIDLVNTNTGGGRFALFAVSGSTGALPPVIAQNPSSVRAYEQTYVSFTASATANDTITYQWQKGTNGVYVNLTDGSNISGSTTTNLTINVVGFNDAADYRLVATDSVGSVPSAVATLTVFSSATDVTAPGDKIDSFGGSEFGDGKAPNVIDDNLGTKLGMDLNGSSNPSGFVVTPAAGLTEVTAVRFYTANDSTGRDPADFTLEGSVDGGNTYTLIVSNSLALPDGRNSSGSPDPLNANLQEVRFSNTNGYTTYRVTFNHYKGGSGQSQMQIGEVELLGTVVQGFFFYYQPIAARAYDQQGSASFSAYATSPAGNPTISWYRGTNGNYVPLSDSGNISGSQTASLYIYPTTFADEADYVAVAYDGSSYVTSSIAHLYIYSTNLDVSLPTDTIVGFGDTTGNRYGGNTNAAYVIDDTFNEWMNGGSGFQAGSGFPPFGGPVGVIWTPSVGGSLIVGLRFYPGQDPAGYDPSGFVLEGSNNGGASWTTIASGALSLPLPRNDLALIVDPTQASAQEVLFSNTHVYTSYRLTFPSIRDPGNFGSLRIGDVEFLGVAATAPPPAPVISTTSISGGNLTINGSGGTPNSSFSVLTNADLSVPISQWGTATTGTYDGSGNFSISLPVDPAKPHLFYLISTP